MPESLIEDAMKRFVDIGWMETEVLADQDITATPQEGAAIPQEGAAKSQDVASLGMEGMEGRNGKKEGSGGTELPAALDEPGFRSAWADWMAYRSKKRKPVSDTAAIEQLADLARYGPATAIEAIRTSIRSDWQGLFPEKIKNANRPTYGAGAGQVYDATARLEGFG